MSKEVSYELPRLGFVFILDHSIKKSLSLLENKAAANSRERGK